MHEKDGVKVNFNWSRGHLFDRMIVVILFERCLTARTARVTKVSKKATSKWKPLPLTTVELQKCGSRFLRMDSQRVMQIAEKLYQDGFISYPRTETDQFDRDMQLLPIVEKQIQSPDWGQFAQGLQNGGFGWPRMGRNNDKAHPPIHPVNFVANTALDLEHRRVYEFVVRRFLACCSRDAQGTKTDVSILYGAETFNASGLMVLERNYLDVYPYDKWTSSQELPIFNEGEIFVPTEARMHEGQTTPPGYLTEPELIGLMDANGIGTDATMAEHIAKIKERDYVMARARGRAPARAGQDASEDEYEPEDGPAERGGRGRGGRGGRGRGGRGGRGGGRGGAANGAGGNGGVQEFIPTTLGVALIEGYESMGFEVSLAKPFLRKEVSRSYANEMGGVANRIQMELKMKAICEGRKTRGEVVHETIEQYRDVYMRTQRQLGMLRAVSLLDSSGC
jgi:DNA topoisomerase-3